MLKPLFSLFIPDYKSEKNHVSITKLILHATKICRKNNIAKALKHTTEF